MTTPSPTPMVYIADEVAEMLRCTSQHVRRLALRGKIPGAFQIRGMKKGGWRFHREPLLAWIAADCPDVNPEPVTSGAVVALRHGRR